MGDPAVYWVVAIHLLATTFISPQIVNSQIPRVCADAESLQSMKCCPDECGGTERGMCVTLSSEGVPDRVSDDVRSNWPHYYNQTCRCNGNYAGYDCSRCKFGYFGEDCSNKRVFPRRNILSLSDSEFDEYITILKMTTTTDSGYVAIMNESVPGSTNINRADLTLYEMFVWVHQFAAKDTACTGPPGCEFADYAHKSTGFLTWHRLHLAWLEWEIQYMLLAMSSTDYQDFRLSYWDWTSNDRGDIFKSERLGANIGSTSEIEGTLFGEGGFQQTLCWFGGSGNLPLSPGAICDPRVDSGPILRCPTIDGVNVCQSPDNWPTTADILGAVNQTEYDTPPFDFSSATNGLRNFLEGEIPGISDEDCAPNPLCIDNLKILLHGVGHVIVGMGNLRTNLSRSALGVMADLASSPNDPVFINHHAMVDCILEEWLQRNPDGTYPDIPETILGHQRDAYIVPFFPLYMHRDFFMTADNFGYSCDILQDETDSSAIRLPMVFHLMISIAMCSLALQFY